MTPDPLALKTIGGVFLKANENNENYWFLRALWQSIAKSST